MRASKGCLPPYFNIDPACLLRSNCPIQSIPPNLQKIGAIATNGCQILAKRGYASDGNKKAAPVFNMGSLNISESRGPTHLRRVLKTHPDLPQGIGDVENNSKWFALEDALKLS